jgi:hypothetical protein
MTGIIAEPNLEKTIELNWRNFVLACKLACISFRGRRHSHVSALVAGGVDALTVCRGSAIRRLAVTTKVYAHLFSETDKTAAKAIEAALRTGKER